jgi:glucose/arabinose dehydrogenase
MRDEPLAVRRVGPLLLCVALLSCGPEFNAPLLNTVFGWTAGPPSADEMVRLRVPPGFSVALFARDLSGARMLRATPAGDILLSRTQPGRVDLIERDADGDGISDGRRTLLEGLNGPHGLDLHEGWLYVAEFDAIGRIRFDPQARAVSGAFERLVTGLPDDGRHTTKTLRFGPDGWMYVSFGSSCDSCVEQDPRRAALVRYRPDGSGEEIYATGLRNAVGFDWEPRSGELYATDNGRDLLGDDFPPCELNRIVQGGFYGWPHAHGNRVPDPELGQGAEARARIDASLPPAHAFRAHNAPLGITFLRHAPERAYQHSALVALHGSWNRSRKDGYEVVSLHWREDGGIEERDFFSGLLVDEDVIGRPVDVLEDAAGDIYVSDNYAGAIYRVTRGAPARAQAPAAAPRAAPADEPAPDPAAVERGARLYAAHGCAGCHDPQRPDPGVLPRPLERLAARYDRAALEALLHAPPPPMPRLALEAGERSDLAAYLLATYR